MEEGRALPVKRRRPIVVLDKRFPFVNLVNVGDKGQLKAIATVESERLQFDEELISEIRHLTIKLIDVDKIDNRGAMIV